MLEEVRFRDEDKIQTENIKRLDAEQDDQKPHKELCKCIASLHAIPAAIDDHADKAEHAQDHAYPAEDRCCPERRRMILRFFLDVLRKKVHKSFPWKKVRSRPDHQEQQGAHDQRKDACRQHVVEPPSVSVL